jgi:hypothetical protein
MDILFTTIEDLLNSLIPSGSELLTEFQSLNEILSYVLTIGVFWVIFLRPILKIFKLVR